MSDQNSEDILTHASIQGPHQNDASMSVVISDDKMEALADFVPPIGNGKILDNDYVGTLLERTGISFGVDWDLIQNSILQCNLERKILRGVPIAKGQAPVEEVAEYYEMDPAFRTWPRQMQEDLPRVDHRELSPFIVVLKDQLLAALKPRVEGKDGTDVLGNVSPKTTSRPESAKAGTNAVQRADGIYASRDGRLTEKNMELSVEEILQIKGAVGYKTGHIMFPGDVVIDGPVADGFKVYAGGSIVTKQTFDASDVVAKKDIVVAGGLIGRAQATIRAGGTVRAKFIQNCRVAARGKIQISAAIINSSVYTMDILDCGDKGRIVGGEIYAIKGVRAAGIGNAAGKTTKLHCGIDFSIQQELDRTNERLKVLSMKLKKLKEYIEGDSDPDKLHAYLDLQKRIEEEMAKMSNHAGQLLGKLDADESAFVEVSGEIESGTLVEICHIALYVEKPLKKIRFRLDKDNGRVISENL